MIYFELQRDSNFNKMQYLPCCYDQGKVYKTVLTSISNTVSFVDYSYCIFRKCNQKFSMEA